MSAPAAAAIADILADGAPGIGRSPARAADGGRRVAFKTGTSYGFRDAWSVGFDRDHTVAVWIGRPDGRGRLGETGASTAVPLMHRVFDALPLPRHGIGAADGRSLLAADVDRLPERLRRFPPAETPGPAADAVRTLTIGFPADGSSVALGRAADGLAPLTIVARGGRAPYRWFVDGDRTPVSTLAERLDWKPPGPGQLDIRVVDSDGRQASSSVWLE